MKIDMHVHTSEGSPDAKVSGAQLARMYKAAGFGAIVVTEHIWERYPENLGIAERAEKWLAGYRAAKEEGEKIGLKVFLGAETRLAKCGTEDFLVYGLEESDVEWLMRTLDSVNTIAELSQVVRVNGFFFAQAHPFRNDGYVAEPELLDGVEAFNGKPRDYSSNNHRAFDFAVDNDLVMLAGSDTHREGDVAHGGLNLPTEIKTNDQLLRWLKAGSLRSRVNFNRRVICKLAL